MRLLSEFGFGDFCVRYYIDDSSGTVGLELLPSGWGGRRQPKNQAIDPIVQLMRSGDDFPPGFSNGHTMRGNGAQRQFAYQGQKAEEADGLTRVVTRLVSESGESLVHALGRHGSEPGVTVTTEYVNGSSSSVTLEMLSSFCLGGITPFVSGDAPESLVLHRLRSKWSNEARLDSIPIEDLQLEPTWSGHGAQSEKFGQVGSMPVRRFFPFAAVEDIANGVTWGAQLACPSSWQMEAYRKDDGLCLSGGLADYDFGHWRKTVKPGESFVAPPAFLSVCVGGVDTLCARLAGMQKRAAAKMEYPVRMPVVFNEFCATWGQPSQANIEKTLAALKGRDIDYFVIDSGWYADSAKGWEANMGDWRVSRELFPNGLEAAVAAIRANGFRPGIWFEAEVCGRDSDAFNMTDLLLKRGGVPITSGSRRFWDMRDSRAVAYLNERVTGLLKDYGFEYVKIDYNESIGTGCDGAESLGEGLRRNMLAARDYLISIRERIPGIVVENCSSGGHRLEPSMLGACQFASFSDAHEEREIPIIAANLHRAMLPEQSLIWAVLRKDDSTERLAWSLCATFLGVMCLSGDVCELSAAQWELVESAIAFYRKVSAVIQDGVTARHGPKVKSYRHPKGWQAVERTSTSGEEKLVVVHPFDDSPREIQIELPGGFYISDTYGAGAAEAKMAGDCLAVGLARGACAVYLKKGAV